MDGIEAAEMMGSRVRERAREKDVNVKYEFMRVHGLRQQHSNWEWNGLLFEASAVI